MPFVKGEPRPANAGRRAGVPNKLTGSVREAIKEAFERVGGVDALVKLHEDNPEAFFTLVGKLVPTEIVAAMDIRTHPPSELTREQIERRLAELAAERAKVVSDN